MLYHYLNIILTISNPKHNPNPNTNPNPNNNTNPIENNKHLYTIQEGAQGEAYINHNIN